MKGRAFYMYWINPRKKLASCVGPQSAENPLHAASPTNSGDVFCASHLLRRLTVSLLALPPQQQGIVRTWAQKKASNRC